MCVLAVWNNIGNGCTGKRMLEFLKNNFPYAYRQSVIIITKEESPLAHYALEQQLTTYLLPINISGRYSVLSAVGLVPAAFVGIDIQALCAGARAITEHILNGSPEENSAYAHGSIFVYRLSIRVSHA